MFTPIDLLALLALLCAGLGAGEARPAPAAVDDVVVQRSAAVAERDVISPPITYPTSGTTWDAGSRQTVTWDTSVIPPGTTSNGMLALGYREPPDDLNEHLDLDHPLAKDFPITVGHIDITVPIVTTRDTYIVVLFGDSGNASKKFTIKNLSIGSGDPSSSSSGAAAPVPAPTPTAAGGGGSGSDSPSAPSPSGAAPSANSDATATPPAPPPSPEVAVPSSPSATATAPASQSPSPAAAGSPTATTPAAAKASSAAHRVAPLGGSSAAAAWTLVSCVLGVVLGAEL